MKNLDLDFKRYVELVKFAQLLTESHPVYPDMAIALWLTIEAGEAADLVLKNQVYQRAVDKEKLTSELGDVLHLVIALAQRYGIELKDVMRDNVHKLTQRGWLK